MPFIATDVIREWILKRSLALIGEPSGEISSITFGPIREKYCLLSPRRVNASNFLGDGSLLPFDEVVLALLSGGSISRIARFWKYCDMPSHPFNPQLAVVLSLEQLLAAHLF